MFICKACATESEWRRGRLKSRGPCEVCHKVSVCAEVVVRWEAKKEEKNDADL